MDADVIVIGAGPAGCSAAYHLVRGGMKVRLLEREEFPREKTCGDALSPEAMSLLREMGLTEFCAQAHRIDGSLVLSPNGDCMETYTPDPGAMVERPALDEALLEVAVAAGAQLETDSTFVELNGKGGRVTARTASGRVFPGQYAVLATGCNAAALKAAHMLDGAAGPSALGRRAYFEGVKCPERLIVHSFDRFLLPGYGWVFPLGDGRANIGVAAHCDAASTRDLKESFERFVGDSLVSGNLLTGARQVSPARTAPLRTGFRGSRPAVGRVLAVGDAAGAAVPSNGEGIPSALITGRLAAEAILRALDNDASPRTAARTYRRSLRRRFARRMRRAGWARRAMGSPRFLNWFVRCARRDRRLADRMCWVLAGVRSPLQLLSPACLKGMLPGVAD
ncbi:MAG: NAD(P)/FAD-dependent oxidoreductase [Candidatus Brocadiia bacterium]